MPVDRLNTAHDEFFFYKRPAPSVAKEYNVPGGDGENMSATFRAHYKAPFLDVYIRGGKSDENSRG